MIDKTHTSTIADNKERGMYGKWTSKVNHMLDLGMDDSLIPAKIAAWEKAEVEAALRPQRIADAKTQVTNEPMVERAEDAQACKVRVFGDHQHGTNAQLFAEPVDGQVPEDTAIKKMRYEVGLEFGFEEGEYELLGAAEEGDELAELVLQVADSRLAAKYEAVTITPTAEMLAAEKYVDDVASIVVYVEK